MKEQRTCCVSNELQIEDKENGHENKTRMYRADFTLIQREGEMIERKSNLTGGLNKTNTETDKKIMATIK